MRKYIVWVLWLLSVVFTACRPSAEVYLSLSSSVVELSVGDVYLLEAEVEGADAAPEWKSDNESVVRVLAGVLTAVSEGTATITAEVAGASASCFVVVNGKEGNQTTTNDYLFDAVRFLPKSHKRGVGYGSPFYLEDVTLLEPALSWAYNWGPDLNASALEVFDNYGLDFVPMAWNGAYDKERIRAYVRTHPACKYILAFNEPNLVDQARYTPQEAAQYWPELKAFADELGLKIVSPAMNYGTLTGYSDPIVWLDEFFSLVPLEDVSAIALHCYMGSAGALRSFVDRFDKYGKPIWMTEFCAWENLSSVENQMDYMSETILMMEADSRVERYAWFLARGSGSVESYPYNQLLTKTDPIELSPLGQVFAGLSSFDRSVWLDPTRHILMNTCSAICTLADAVPIASPHFRPLPADPFGTMEMQGFSTGKWIEFQLEAAHDLTRFRLRHSSYLKTVLELTVDGTTSVRIELPRASTDGEWEVVETALILPAGKHTLRLTNISGNTNLHWFNMQ